MSYLLELIIPCVPPNKLPKTTTNARSTWQARLGEANKWKRKIAEYVVLGQRTPKQPLAKAKLTLIRYASGLEPDYDNLVSTWKHVIDGLVEAKVLSDDSPAVIGQPFYKWERSSRLQQRIFIQVQEIEE